ncbi:NADH-quinone oxidoreductase subunit C [Streptomyces polyrhachis]|uniref:NADH-quinone oxidoreductase subunit C n=1 Tax=Streptomyces polyrhachis TaxID=1282885 RepID=A0ABW2GIV2_9ACTN
MSANPAEEPAEGVPAETAPVENAPVENVAADLAAASAQAAESAAAALAAASAAPAPPGEVPEVAAAVPVGWLPAPAEAVFGPGAVAEEEYELLTVDVPAGSWTEALRTARDELGCTYLDWLSAVDMPPAGYRVSAHVVAVGDPVRALLVRTTVPHEAPALPSAIGVYAGAAWHERETHEMFGIDFPGNPDLSHLLLYDGFEGYPLRKDFVLAARVVKPWPGAKEPGEGAEGGPKRRQTLPPGVPDPNEWGPLKGQLPPAPARPARGARAARGAAGGASGEAAERPVRRARSASQGSASQTAAEGARPASAEPRRAPSRPPRSPDAPWQRGAAAEGAPPAPPAPEPSEQPEGGEPR